MTIHNHIWQWPYIIHYTLHYIYITIHYTLYNTLHYTMHYTIPITLHYTHLLSYPSMRDTLAHAPPTYSSTQPPSLLHHACQGGMCPESRPCWRRLRLRWWCTSGWQGGNTLGRHAYGEREGEKGGRGEKMKKKEEKWRKVKKKREKMKKKRRKVNKIKHENEQKSIQKVSKMHQKCQNWTKKCHFFITFFLPYFHNFPHVLAKANEKHVIVRHLKRAHFLKPRGMTKMVQCHKRRDAAADQSLDLIPVVLNRRIIKVTLAWLNLMSFSI